MTPWRFAYFGIILFWLSMTFMLIQRTYFPDAGGAQPISVMDLLQRFSQTNDYLNNLTLLRGTEKLGHASISAKLWEHEATHLPQGMELHAGGMVDGAAWSQPGASMSWSFSGKLDQQQLWKTLDVRVRTPTAAIIMQWTAGQEEPLLEVRRDGALIADLKSLKQQAKTMTLIPGFSGLQGLPLGALTDSGQDVSLEKAITFSATASTVSIAGQKRAAQLLKLSLFGLVESQFTFTQAGELAEATLPNGYRLQDPVIFGLEETHEATRTP
jgi:hypothetical protein